MSDTRPTQRREMILAALRRATEPLPGDDLGAQFGIGRTAICSDVTVLRAEGHAIVSTPRGYVLQEGRATGYSAVVHVRHGPDRVEEELCALVDAGVTVADVVVDHPTYGELRGELQIRGRDEVAQFVQQVREGTTRLLSELTNGWHAHTLWAADPARLDRARAKLGSLGLLQSEGVAAGNGRSVRRRSP